MMRIVVRIERASSQRIELAVKRGGSGARGPGPGGCSGSGGGSGGGGGCGAAEAADSGTKRPGSIHADAFIEAAKRCGR